MNLAATLRAITTASAHIPAAPSDSMWGRAPHRALPDLAGAELLKKELRRTATHHTTDLADPEARAYLLLGLLGEIGELVTEALRPAPDRAKIIAEAGDVLWSLDAILAQHGADLSDAVRALEHKMLTRPTTAPRMAAAGYRPAPTTIEDLLREPGWSDDDEDSSSATYAGSNPEVRVRDRWVLLSRCFSRAGYSCIEIEYATEADAVAGALKIVDAI
jgi:NTP pyrophosphatase (non-canonical NTP hydrolase)